MVPVAHLLDNVVDVDLAVLGVQDAGEGCLTHDRAHAGEALVVVAVPAIAQRCAVLDDGLDTPPRVPPGARLQPGDVGGVEE